jgi:hypothetical protein
MVVRFVGIGGIVGYHWINILFIIIYNTMAIPNIKQVREVRGGSMGG